MSKQGDLVIKLTIGGHPAYLADRPEWDAAWFTRDLGNARRYARKANAERVIRSYDQWPASYAAKVESLSAR